MQPFVIVPALWATIVLAWDASKIDCGDDSLCFTSFVWCDSQGSGCSYPEGVYPPVADPQDINYALLMENVNHTISWKVSGQDTETPVRVQWELDEGVSWELSSRSDPTRDDVEERRAVLQMLKRNSDATAKAVCAGIVNNTEFPEEKYAITLV
ncbi:uncharacterized protein PG998_013242 [Apiospora kogelbergensis]|uniref:uncharacterized protein n=1 Tax=Apiospora kogelbergensis TaxID=1337665 RepID=UPI00312F12E8